MNAHRTLREDRRGFSVEIGKRRNLLNSAGSDVRPGSLGHRRTARALSDTRVIYADGSEGVIPRIRRNARIAPVVESAEVYRPRLKNVGPPRHPLHRYLDFVERFPNVLALYRSRPTSARIVDVSLGAGRGW